MNPIKIDVEDIPKFCPECGNPLEVLKFSHFDMMTGNKLYDWGCPRKSRKILFKICGSYNPATVSEEEIKALKEEINKLDL